MARAASKNIVDPSRLNGAEKCAVVLLALGEEHAHVWQALDEDEIKEVSQAMAGLGTVSAQVVEDLLVEFVSGMSGAGAVMKRVSVWRSKALKMSAIISWLSRLEVRARFDMNSLRSVCSILSRISRCTGSIRSMRMTHSRAKSSGSEARTRAACSDLIFDSTTATVCGDSFFR